MSVRGLVLPVLVAARDVAPGQLLLLQRGAGWWREVAWRWDFVVGFTEADGRALMHGQAG